MNGEDSGSRDARLETFAAELTLAAYGVALQTRTRDTWVDLELGLWRVLADTVKMWGKHDRLGKVAPMTTMLERGQQLVRGELPPPPIARLLGIVAKSVEPGRAVFELEADERHHNPMGTLHGGVYCDLADAAMGFAYGSTLAEGETFTTVELKINFLRAVRKATLTAEARVVKAGSTLGYVECDVTDEAGRLVARAASTCMKLRETPPAER
ncbi:MAG TPA: PaaI family thioesterase [Gemmataceae bacterium]|nr:PaaI family thioesterase [Gemmataceae bacterium]